MNAHSPTTAVGSSTSPLQLTAGDGFLTHALDKQKLTGFTMQELCGARDSTALLAGVLLGLVCQGRYMQRDTRHYTAAGDVLDQLLEIANHISDALEDEMERRSDAVGDDAVERACALLQARAARGEFVTSDGEEALPALYETIMNRNDA